MRIQLREVFWMVALCGCLSAWFVDHRSLQKRIESLEKLADKSSTGIQALNEPAALESLDYPLGLDGFCPVTLTVEGNWKRGQPQFGAQHRRRTFLFAGEAEQQQFLLDPDRYAPVLTGYDAVRFVDTGEFIEGSTSHSRTYRKQVYLFVDEASLQAFSQNPTQYVEKARDAMSRSQGDGGIP